MATPYSLENPWLYILSPRNKVRVQYVELTVFLFWQRYGRIHRVQSIFFQFSGQGSCNGEIFSYEVRRYKILPKQVIFLNSSKYKNNICKAWQYLQQLCNLIQPFQRPCVVMEFFNNSLIHVEISKLYVGIFTYLEKRRPDHLPP